MRNGETPTHPIEKWRGNTFDQVPYVPVLTAAPRRSQPPDEKAPPMATKPKHKQLQANHAFQCMGWIHELDAMETFG